MRAGYLKKAVLTQPPWLNCGGSCCIRSRIDIYDALRKVQVSSFEADPDAHVWSQDLVTSVFLLRYAYGGWPHFGLGDIDKPVVQEAS
ncbi:hypothetical protein U1Q18_026414 [Sarracenia purpurea var. burkii]